MPLPWKYRSRPRSVAFSQRTCLIRSGWPMNSWYRAINNAAAALTCGAAMLVPSIVVTLPPGIGAVIFSPGATRSGFSRPSPVGPRLEKYETP